MFSPGDFIQKVNEYGGLDRPNLFMVMFYPANGNIDPDMNLRFFCKTTAFPGVDIATTEYKAQTYGMGGDMPTGIMNPGLSCIFILDSNNRVLSYFHRWGQKVLNYDTGSGIHSMTDGKLPYEIGYLRGPRGYGMTCVITKFNAHTREVIYEAEFRDVFPKNIGSVNLAWEDTNTYATLPVSFSFSEMSISGNQFGTTGGDFNRGQSEIERIAGLGRRAATINEFVDANIVAN